jgi:hypothetical protein
MEGTYPAQTESASDVKEAQPNGRIGLILLLGLALLLALAGIAYLSSRDDATSGSSDGATQRIDGGNVTVAVTWEGVTAGPVFDVVLDTHSVDLDGIDLSSSAVLRVDGAEVQPLSWDAPKGGHHRSGTLTFPATTADGSPVIDSGSTVELVIRDVADVAERTYQWNP